MFLVAKNYKVRFIAAIIAAINEAFLNPLLLAVISILVSACGDKYKIFRLALEYKETEQVDLHAECVLLINKVEEGRQMMMENVPQNRKLTLFLDYYVQQLLENRNVPTEMWNVNKHRYTQLSIPTHAQLQRHRLKFIKNHLKNSYVFRSSTIFRELQCPR